MIPSLSDPPPAPAEEPLQQLGKEGLAFFKEIIGGPPSGWALERSGFALRLLDFSLVKGPRRLEFTASPELRGPEEGGGLGFRLRSTPEDLSEEDRELVRAIAAGLATTNFGEAITRLRRDCLGYYDPDGNRGPSRLDRYYRLNDHSPYFWKFVYPQWRCLEQMVELGSHWARINHATLECRLSSPTIETPSLRFFASEPTNRGDLDCKNVETPLTAADVLNGSTQELLGRTLIEVAREDKPAYIHVNTTCLPELIGDSPLPFIGRIETEQGVPVFWTSKTRPGGPIYSAWIERLLDQATFSPNRDPRAVLLAGVPCASAQAEAAALCGALGLRVVGTILPNIDFRRSPEMNKASAVVWLDPVGWETIGDGPFLRHDLAVVRHHPPYGLAGTRDWLGRIASVLGLKGGEEAFSEAFSQERAAQLDSLRGECRRRTVALIGDAADIELLVVQRRFFGFSPAALLGELGFNVRCLVFSARERAQADALRRPREPAGAGTIEFVPFDRRSQLDRQLARGVDLVFSHFNHDPRLHAHGLLGFTESAFDLGIDGLLRSGRRLLAKCGARPFPRHRTFLAGWTR